MVSLHCPLTPETHHLIDAAALAAMRADGGAREHGARRRSSTSGRSSLRSSKAGSPAPRSTCSSTSPPCRPSCSSSRTSSSRRTSAARRGTRARRWGCSRSARCARSCSTASARRTPSTEPARLGTWARRRVTCLRAARGRARSPSREEPLVEHPFIYEINTWVWLDELRRRVGKKIGLAGVPAKRVGRDRGARVRRRLADGRVGAEPGRDRDRAPERRARRELPRGAARRHERRTSSARRTASATTRSTRTSAARRASRRRATALAKRGARADPRLRAEPRRARPSVDGRRIPSTSSAATRTTSSATRPRSSGSATACSRNGRDPFFPAWPDVVQLNAFSPDLRAAVVETLGSIADQCDGVRCDMAMLMMNDVFERTWGERAGPRPADDYWPTVIAADQGAPSRTSSSRPRRTGISSGRSSSRASTSATTSASTTGSCTRTPSRCTATSAATSATRTGSSASSRTTTSRARPPRSRPAKARAAAVTTLDPDRRAARARGAARGADACACPSSSRGGPTSRADDDLRGVLRARCSARSRDPVFRTGDWQLGERRGWEGNDTWRNLVAWGWRGDGPRKLVVVNLGDAPASGHVSLPWDDLRGRTWRLDDAATGEAYERDAATTSATGSTSRSIPGRGTSST